MLYVIRRTGMTDHYLLPACFEPEIWSSEGMPAQARKFSSAGDAALCCASLPGLSVVDPLPGTGHAYELPTDPKADEDLAYRILTAASPASPNGKAH
jgi:hypothetical protein